ncbi:TIGR02206 family membrane protein [Mycoplasmatota bacterium]|nr:TIGR02206 family membrane protein [Mycoplasmatota bacterium]
MKDFFSYEPSNNIFRLYSIPHIIMLIVFAVMLALLYVSKDKIRKSKYEKVIRISFASIVLSLEIMLYFWYILNGQTDLALILPFEVCGFALYFGVFMMYFKNYKLFRLGYYWSFGANIAILFPPILYSFDRFRFYQYLFNHMFIFIMYLYMYFVHKFKPTLKAYIQSILFMILVAPIMYILNIIMDANFFVLSSSEGAPFEWLRNMDGPLFTLVVVTVGISLFSIGNIHYLFTRKKRDLSHQE